MWICCDIAGEAFLLATVLLQNVEVAVCCCFFSVTGILVHDSTAALAAITVESKTDSALDAAVVLLLFPAWLLLLPL